MRVKGRIAPENVKGVVYRVDCDSCDHSYIGETGRTLNIRLKENQRAVQMSDVKNGIAVHANTTEHAIDWTSAIE